MDLPATTCAATARQRAPTGVAERDAVVARMIEGLGGGVRREDARPQIGGAAARVGKAGEAPRDRRAALGVQVEQPLRQLGHLGDAARHRDARSGCARICLSMAADENRPCR